MKQIGCFVLLGFLFLLTSCKIHKNNNSEDINLTYSWEVLSIDTEGNPLSFTDRATVYCDSVVEYYATYNEANVSLVIYNLETGRFERRINFFSSGPNKVDYLNSYTLWNNAVWNSKNDQLQKISFDGVISERLTIGDICPDIADNYSLKPNRFTISNLIRHHYRVPGQPIIVLKTFNKENGFSNIFKKPIFVEYNLETRESHAHHVQFPDEFERMYWADLEFPNIITKGDSIIYNFPFKAAIYLFDKNSQKTHIKEFSAVHIPQIVEGRDVTSRGGTKASFELLFGDKYHQIDYDPHRNLYYMLYSEAKVDDEPLQRHLIVFNKKIEKILEIDLPTDLSPNFAISRQGLLFRNVNDDSFNTLTLHVLNVVVEQQ